MSAPLLSFVPARAITAPLVTFRDTLRKLCPPWLQNGLAEKVLYSIGVQLDAMGDAVVAGVKMRFPDLYSAEPLALIGAERRIRRGALEDDATYASRLRTWLMDHRTRGGPYALLTQLYRYYAPNTFRIDLLYKSGLRFSMELDGTINRDFMGGVDAPMWSRWVLIYYPGPHTPPYSDPELDDLAVIPREWIAEHCLAALFLFANPDDEIWDYPPERVWDEAPAWDSTDPIRIKISGEV